ncbi:expansin-like A2 [Carex littledalei]|uniref:Expansin-like A2 n=1 Tax=Carex littledalei TaxID=544730 RepID=A0A833QHJ4_9POAL|nr:expansin-like A2 [Carex littledalei]
MSRTPCEYNKNLSIRVEERSRKPGHLTIKFLYQGGQTDVMAVEVAQAKQKMKCIRDKERNSVIGKRPTQLMRWTSFKLK